MQVLMEICSLNVTDDTKPYSAPLRLQGQWVLALLMVDETAEWCNSFIIVPKPYVML